MLPLCSYFLSTAFRKSFHKAIDLANSQTRMTTLGNRSTYISYPLKNCNATSLHCSLKLKMFSASQMFNARAR